MCTKDSIKGHVLQGINCKGTAVSLPCGHTRFEKKAVFTNVLHNNALAKGRQGFIIFFNVYSYLEWTIRGLEFATTNTAVSNLFRPWAAATKFR